MPNLQPFTGNGDVSIWLKFSRVGRKTPNKQIPTQKITPSSQSAQQAYGSLLIIKGLQTKFANKFKGFDDVSSPQLTRYNGHAGPFEAYVNRRPVQPPQRKGRLLKYSRNHIQFQHPSCKQLKSVIRRYFFALYIVTRPSLMYPWVATNEQLVPPFPMEFTDNSYSLPPSDPIPTDTQHPSS